MESVFLIQATLDGIMIGMFYVLVALGLTLMFGILHVFNFAHGEIYMIGGFVAYYFFGQFHLNYFLTLVIGLIVGIIVGIVLERLIFRPFRAAPFNGFIASLGVIWILQTVAAVSFGVIDKNVPTVFGGVFKIMGATVSIERLTAMLISIAMVASIYFFIKRTKTGKALRAVAQDKEGASLQGISVDRTCAIAFGLGSGLATAAGVIMSPIFFVNPYIGAGPVVKAFMVIILGGMGSIPGAILGGLILGFVESFSALKFGVGAILAMGFGIVILVLLVRPKGLLGRG